MAIPRGGPEKAPYRRPFEKPPALQHGRVLEQGPDHDGLHQLDGDKHHDGRKVQPADVRDDDW